MNVVVITGSRKGHPLVHKWMEEWVHRKGPTRFVVGDATGVDAQAYLVCMQRGWECEMVRVDKSLGSPAMFRDRDRRMVELGAGGTLLGFPRPDSKGAWLMHDLAQKAGMVCFMAPVWTGEKVER